MGNFQIQPPQASEFAPKHDALFWAITALTVFFTVVTFAIVVFLAIKYRDTNHNVNRDNPQHESLKLELGWSLPPLLLGIGIFVWSTTLFIHERIPQKNASEIFVIGKQWMWHIQHSNGVRETNELHVPVGRPIKLTMISQDVIHAFYIPAFRAQYHVVPGRYTTEYFTPTLAGRYPLFCAMHCGTQHSEMGGYVTVMPARDFDKWLADGGNERKPVTETLAQRGETIWKEKMCGSCHGVEDTAQGPSLLGVAGSVRKMSNGEQVLVNAEYMRESIVDPAKRILAGYTETMPQDYKNYFNEEQMLSLISYMQTLGVQKQPEPAKAVPATRGNR